MGVKTLLLVSLLVVLELRLLGAVVSGGRRHGDRLMPGSPSNISRNDRGVQQLAFTAARSFNSQSNDAFLFRPSAIHRAQRQVVRGLRYIVELQISRTVCHKRDHEDLDRCELQPPGPLQQSFQCHLEAWVVPWRNQTTIQKFTC